MNTNKPGANRAGARVFDRRNHCSILALNPFRYIYSGFILDGFRYISSRFTLVIGIVSYVALMGPNHAGARVFDRRDHFTMPIGLY